MQSDIPLLYLIFVIQQHVQQRLEINLSSSRCLELAMKIKSGDSEHCIIFHVSLFCWFPDEIIFRDILMFYSCFIKWIHNFYTFYTQHVNISSSAGCSVIEMARVSNAWIYNDFQIFQLQKHRVCVDTQNFSHFRQKQNHGDRNLFSKVFYLSQWYIFRGKLFY